MERLEARTLLAAQAAPPSVTAFEFDLDGRALRYTFSTDVSASVAPSDLVLYNTSEWTTVASSKVAAAASGGTVTFTFPGYSGGVLPEGNYQATLYASEITDSAGTPMAADRVDTFFRLNADANGDRVVNVLDFNILAANFAKENVGFTRGDYNHDGVVNVLDFNILAAQFARSMPSPQPAPRLMDVATFNTTPEYSTDHFTQIHFDHLNTPSATGRFMAMGGDTRRSQLRAKGNFLAVYYNTLNSPGYLLTTSDQKADQIHQYVLDRFTATGEKPTYLVLNELSAGAWPSVPEYRAWVRGVVRKLHVTYGHEVVLFSPFPRPANHPADWQDLTRNAIIAVENYLSGQEIKESGFSLAWAQAEYQASKNAYLNTLKIPSNRLWLGEHFAQTVANTSWGRSGVSIAEWDAAIRLRAQATRNVGFAGFISYAWGKNGMQVSDAEMVHFMDTYRAEELP